MSARLKPPLVLAWLLRRLTLREAADAAIGDIFEILQERVASRRAPRWPSLWLRIQVAAAIWSVLRAVTPRIARSWGHTFRDALRGMRRHPSQALFIVLVLAVGMSAATVTFSVVDATVLRPLPFEEGDRIVTIFGRRPTGISGLSPEAFWVIHDHVKGLDSIATTTQFSGAEVSVDGVTENLVVLNTTAGLFRVLRLNAFIGSVWTRSDETADPQVAVVTHTFWQRRFGGDPGVLGHKLRIGKTDYRVIGVLAPGVKFPSSMGVDAEVWVPEVPARATVSGRYNRINPVARLAPGVSIEQLVSEIESTLAPLAAANPTAYSGWRLDVRRFRDGLRASVRPWMLLALGCVCLVLLIACANAANVMLTRSWERSRELAVRASLGASGRQLGATLLIESLSLSIAACVVAMLFARWGSDAAKSVLPVRPFGWDVISLDARVMTAAIVAAIFTGLVCGIVPGWQASRVPVLTLLKDGGATATARRRGWRSVFLIAQVASVAALLVVASLFIGSFVRVITADLGLDRSNLIGVSTLTGNGPRVAEFHDRLRAIAGVRSVAAVGLSTPPLVAAFGGAFHDMNVYRSDSGAGAQEVKVRTYAVTPEYFDVVGTPFRQGRVWPAQRAPDQGVVPIVIDEPTARTLFGGESPLGRLLRQRDSDRMFTITGVVPYLLAGGPEGTRLSSAYYPLDAAGRAWVGFFIRTSLPAGPVARDVHKTLQSMVRPGQWPNVHLADDAFTMLTALRRFNGLLMSLFAVLAVLIGCAGVYAAVASAVAQRTREIGVRIALGATVGEIRRSVLVESGRYLILGLAIGLPAGWLMSRGFGSIFFQVAPGDFSIHAIVAAVLVVAGLVAAFIPARRASRVDPVVTLRAR